MDYTENEHVNRLPKHLRSYIVEQNYANYTPIDHAVWRYIMRINFDFLSKHAHISYINGLKATGLSVEKIPDINEMNEILSRIGWGAVCVDGFIPPAAFMEFQAYNVLVIAADIRNIQHITYTPAPDIVHEAAGHAPIISDAQYAEYLRLFGEIGSKAFASKKDIELYEAIRKLSILKENTYSKESEIKEAEEEIFRLQNNMGELSELAKIRNLHWWTVEYGLIGSIENPKIYGAGLLSSIGESANCLHESVKKIPYSLEAANYSFDITTQQPHLFVTPDFKYLTEVLNNFADTMALRHGGSEGIRKAINSNAIASCELSSGLQISGIFTDQIIDENNNPIYIKTTGPSMLCEREKLLIGHSIKQHHDGFGSPIGKLRNCEKALEKLCIDELESMNVEIGKEVQLEFESGIRVQGKLFSIRRNKHGKILLMTFEECTVRYQNQILFDPSWGVFDMAVGETIVSVWAGPADSNELETSNFISSTTTIHNPIRDLELLQVFAEVRTIRENNLDMMAILKKVQENYSNEWLLLLEIYEYLYRKVSPMILEEIKNQLLQLATENDEKNKLIEDGLMLIEKD